MASRSKKRWLVRWRRASWITPVIGLILLTSVVSYFLFWPQSHDDNGAQLGSILLFVFLYLNVVILCALAFVVGRNVVKLIFDRKRKILGSKLRLRLVVAFVGLTAVPTAILFLLASGLLTQVMEGWFNSQIETSLESAVVVAKSHLAEVKQETLKITEALAQEAENRKLSRLSKASVSDFLESRRKEHKLYSIRVFSADQKIQVEVSNATSGIENFREPNFDAAAVSRALAGESIVLKENLGSNIFVRAYVPLKSSGESKLLISSYRVSDELAQAVSVVNDSYKSFEQLKLYKDPLKSWYLLTLSMITGSIIFGAIWIGFYIAREITVPIQRLAEGTRAVARGNYDFVIQAQGDDELGVLVRSFNLMTSDLKHSRAEAERRRLYIETILTNLAVGVIGLDTSGKITSMNDAAKQLYECTDSEVLGQELSSLMREADWQSIQPLLDVIDRVEDEQSDSAAVVEREITLMSRGRELKLVCTVGHIQGMDRSRLGTLLLFDDITDLVKAQHMSAWREVARRIAHEIKNPLTPIQLSAQRLQKILSDTALSKQVQESTQTIVEHVDSIKRLANEFSNFARMPTAEFKPTNLNLLISDTITPYAESNSEVAFQFIADNKLPDVTLDPEQIRRVLINLLDNALAAVLSNSSDDAHDDRRIQIKSGLDRKRKVVTIEVADNGPGIPHSEKSRIFEPYFTTKKSGTGLGLAIVTSIISDHQGQIRVYDNLPHGAKFVVDLPLAPRSTTQRRLVSST